MSRWIFDENAENKTENDEKMAHQIIYIFFCM